MHTGRGLGKLDVVMGSGSTAPAMKLVRRTYAGQDGVGDRPPPPVRNPWPMPGVPSLCFGASSYTFAEKATRSGKLPDWLAPTPLLRLSSAGCRRSWCRITLRQRGEARATATSRTSPQLRDLGRATTRGGLVPARARKPRDQAKGAEVGVQVVERWITRPRLRNRQVLLAG